MFRTFTKFLTLLLLLVTSNSVADYPILSHRYLADPAALVYNDRVYIYASNDDDNSLEDGYEMQSIVCISSSDLKNWTDHGEVFRVPRDASWAGLSWAPSAVERNGQFYLYFPNGASNIGVAVSDSPIGPFTDPIGEPLVDASTPGVLPGENIWIFDPMTFVDDDGRAFMYFGGNGDDNMRIIELNEDMISTKGSATSFTVPDFFEAAWMHKRNGLYYLSYSTNPDAGLRIDYMMSDNPTTGFTYAGVFSPQPPDNNNNNHHAVFEFKGSWYQAYHNRTVANQAGIVPTYKRNLCIDEFFYNPDGTIQTMENTVDGVAQVGFINPYERVEAETMDSQRGIYTAPNSEGGMSVINIDNNDYIKVRGVDFGEKGPAAFSASFKSEFKYGNRIEASVELRLGSINGTLIGTAPISYTGDEDSWKTETIELERIDGVHDLFFVFKGEADENLFEFDYWYFTEKRDTQELLAINAVVDSYKVDTKPDLNSTSIAVTAIYADGSAQDVTSFASFTFDQENIVSVNEGTVTGINEGELFITAAYEGKTDSVRFIVKNLDAELTVAELESDISEVQLFAGGTTELSIQAIFEDGHREDISDRATYFVENTNVCTVSSAGVVTGIAEGETTVEVSFQGGLGEAQSLTIPVIVQNGISIWLEIECANVGSLWSIVEDNLASNGEYTTIQSGLNSIDQAPSGREGQITIPFEVEVPATYFVYFRVICPSPNDDSFWVKMDDGNFNLWNGIQGSEQWIWTPFPGTFDLATGSHTLSIGYREDGTRIDKVWITNANQELGTVGGVASNCGLLSLRQAKYSEGITIYPNFVKDRLTYELASDAEESIWVIYDATGKIVLQGKGKSQQTVIDVRSLKNGLYLIAVEQANKTYLSRLVVGRE